MSDLNQAKQLSTTVASDYSLPAFPRLERIDPASVMKYNADVQLMWDRVRQQYAANMQALIQQVKGQ